MPPLPQILQVAVVGGDHDQVRPILPGPRQPTQDRDLEAVVNALAIRNVPSTRIRSTGGFLRQENHVLLVGVPEAKLEEAVRAIDRVSSSRTEFVPESLEASGLPLAAGRPVEVHGATVFVLDVEHFEGF